jgi:hypothetical protein
MILKTIFSTKEEWVSIYPKTFKNEFRKPICHSVWEQGDEGR